MLANPRGSATWFGEVRLGGSPPPDVGPDGGHLQRLLLGLGDQAGAQQCLGLLRDVRTELPGGVPVVVLGELLGEAAAAVDDPVLDA
ncbi:hypothetical protein ACFWQC_02725 [Nocardioides sp. NPDC058538]|uniref:hypothetical protein n=1 Tax=Nocardioides sp. NPDC058538 TaxID=3346542 RepID=UPI00365AA43F